ncbi:MAG TPA: nitrous oxide reductase accessory protein NosL [Bacteroidia bacterium]|nr:nitrous oxide reductase accessory protein NosL [Bacteroidia bacterium]
MNDNKISSDKMTTLMKAITACCSVMMIIVLFFPIWKIELSAPQYPEGLVLKIHANKLGGNVDVVNGLNHYIGMRTLHEDDFIEFTVLPFIIGGFAALGFLTLILNRRKIFNAWVVLLLVIAVVSMADFYKWEYNYGHELNPDAPIKVPGMSYQPPLIGYKKLLNFGAYSIPDIGGWIFIAVGALLVTTWYIEFRKNKKTKSKPALSFALPFLSVLFFASCSTEPQTIRYGKDACAFCKMNIVDEKFSAQCMSTKGKSYRFDDIHCVASFLKNGGVWRNELAGVYFSDFNEKNKWINSDVALLLQSDSLHSPMGWNMAAFDTEQERDETMKQFNGKKLAWKDINPFNKK